MNPVLKKFCAGRGLEYLKVDEHWRIQQDFSHGVRGLAIAPETLAVGKDICELLPELSQWKKSLSAVLTGQTDRFQLKQIHRVPPHQPPVCFDLWAFAFTEGNQPHELIVFLEDTTEFLLREEKLAKQDK